MLIRKRPNAQVLMKNYACKLNVLKSKETMFELWCTVNNEPPLSKDRVYTRKLLSKKKFEKRKFEINESSLFYTTEKTCKIK